MEVVVMQSIFLGALLTLTSLFLVKRFKLARAQAKRKSAKVVDISKYQTRKTGASRRKGIL